MEHHIWKIKFKSLIVVFILIVGTVACALTPEERYKALEKAELASGVTYDSLFMGLHFGMSKNTFREYCYDQHLEQQFYQGGQRNSIWVEADIDEMEYPATINFYPEFKAEKITEMNASIYYRPDVQFKDEIFEKDSLLLDVLNLMDSWYGPERTKIRSPFFYKEDVYVKVNGNRRITIYPDQTGQMINLWFVDLTSLPKDD